MGRLCPSCGHAITADARFCDECGTPLSTGADATATGGAIARAAPAAELRRVSVLFADLVGFTALGEQRDAEEVRELLTRYFTMCRELVTRYGGVVEKFIGDAVMAVWGAPVTHEDDAERAVRAALDLLQAVAALGADIGVPTLQVRAGVSTGEAAATVGAESEGMVAGDLVNTTSRIQAVAAAGTVLVSDATRRATEAAVAYEDAGEHALKGKSESVHLWRPLRVVAGRGGALRSEGLEPPFVGRERELRLVKDLFHAGSAEKKAQAVSILGVPGVGKSRLAWEFEKYIDGLAETVLWHRGRCLAYGEGVTYWALAEMVRMRAGIAEAEEPDSARAKLQGCLLEFLPDAEERRWAEPRLAHLLALEEHATLAREDLFGAWRLFFERLSSLDPTILVFEEMQWADTSLLEFVEYLLQWSRNHPLFVVTLARPELLDRHPAWGAGKRNFTSVSLEALTEPAMQQLLDGLVPGLPDEVRERILQRSEGIPLYAVETVRMLLDRGVLSRAGSVYRVAQPIDDLAVPPSLQGLIAARLDGLAPEARRVVQEASVLGKTFSATSLASISGMPLERLQPILSDLVAKEVLSLQADPRSPERGQYGFIQDLMKRVAYETLSKHDRKEKHLAVARWFENAWAGEEADVVEVIAAHYLEAYNLAPHDADAETVRERAAGVLGQAGERAASLAASAEAERYFVQAARLMHDSASEAQLYERAGQMAWIAGHSDRAIEHLNRSIEVYQDRGERHPAARVSARLAEVQATRGQLETAIDRLEAAFTELESDPPDADLAALAVQLGRFHFFSGDVAAAERRTQLGLDIAELLKLPEVLSQGLNTKGIIAIHTRHPEESIALFSHALKIALEHDLPSPALRAYYNLSDAYMQRDRYADALDGYRKALAFTRLVGDRFWERNIIGDLALALASSSDWNAAADLAAQISEDEFAEAHFEYLSLLQALAMFELNRGETERLERWLRRFEEAGAATGVQEASVFLVSRASWLRAVGRTREALEVAEQGLAGKETLGPAHQVVKAGFVEATEAALELGDSAKAEQLVEFVEGMQPGERAPYLCAQAARLRARLEAAKGRHGPADEASDLAVRAFRDIDARFWLGVTLLEWWERRASSDSPAHQDESMRDEAVAIFNALDARPWLQRASQRTSVPAVAS